MKDAAVWAAAIVAVLGAGATVWRMLIKPMFALIFLLREILPILKEFAKAFSGKEGVPAVLAEVAEQLRTNHGSSVKDIILKLEKASEENARQAAEARHQAELLAISAEAARQLAVRDREEQARILRDLDRVAVKVDMGLSTLGSIQRNAGTVADELHKSQVRADSAEGPPGHKADEAAGSEGGS